MDAFSNLRNNDYHTDGQASSAGEDARLRGDIWPVYYVLKGGGKKLNNKEKRNRIISIILAVILTVLTAVYLIYDNNCRRQLEFSDFETVTAEWQEEK